MKQLNNAKAQTAAIRFSITIALSTTIVWAPIECRIGALKVTGLSQSAMAAETTESTSELSIDRFLMEAWANPFAANANGTGGNSDSASNNSASFVQNLAREVALTFQTVVAMEESIIKSETALRSLGFDSPVQFLEQTSRIADTLPESAKEAIRKSESPHELAEHVLRGEAPFNTEESAQLRNMTLAAKELLQNHFQEKRIAHTKAYFRLAIGLGVLNAYDLAMELKRQNVTLDEPTRAKYEKLFARLAESAKSYLQNEALYEGPKRNMAVTPHNDFLRTLKKISGLTEVLEKAESTSSELEKNPRIARESRTLSQAIFVYIKRFVTGVIATPAILYHASKLILSLKNQQTYQPGTNSAAAKPGELVLPNSVMEITRRIAPVLGLKIEIEAPANWRAEALDGVAILTPTHRNALRDMVAVAALRFKNMAFYANAGQIMNMIFGRGDTMKIIGKTFNTLELKRRIVGMANRNPGILVAGPTHNPDREDSNFKPVQKSIQLMADGVQTFLNYPHGALPSHLGVDLPIVESWFGRTATLAEAWRRGLAPKLIVVTLPYNVDPLGLGLVPEYGKGLVKVRVDGIMPGELIKTMTAFGGETVLRYLFEANSNLGMVTNEHLHRGHIRTSSLPEMIDRTMGRSRDSRSSTMSIRACEALFQKAN